MSDSTQTVGAVETCFDLVEAIDRRGVGGVTELADAVGISKGAAHKQLQTLRERGYVTQRNGEYELTLRFLGLGRSLQRNRQLFTVGREFLDELAATTGAISGLLVREGTTGSYLYRTGEGVHEAPLYEGKRSYLHTTAGGKAILAQLETEQVEEIAEQQGLPELTTRTTTDRTALLNELQSIKDRGLAFDRGEHSEGWQGVATPIETEETLHGAISVYGQVPRMRGKTLTEDIPGLLLSIGNDLEMALREALY